MFAASKTASVSGGYQISRSLRFNTPDGTYLNRTPASAGNRKTWTWSAWVKRSSLTTTQQLFTSRPTSSPYALIYFDSTNNNLSYDDTGSFGFTTSATFRDVSAWYHIVISIDTTQATSTNRIKVYINNVAQTFSSSNYGTQNFDTQINTATEHKIGTYSGEFFSGYMTEINFIDGQALTPSSFGYYDSNTGVWTPTRFVGTYGTNGFYLNFSDNSNTTAATLGKDYSGNGNNWTPNNFSVSAGAGNDSLVDSPTSYGTDTGVGGEVRGNYATMNALQKGSFVTLTNGNLDSAVGASDGKVLATIGMSSGKWYAEVSNFTGSPTVGIATGASTLSSFTGGDAYSWGYYPSGSKYTNGSSSAYGASWTTTDTIGIAFDADAGTLTFYKNGSSQGTAYSSLTSGPYFFSNGNSANTLCSWNFGQRPFAYTAPSGYKALCTKNLPTPTIGATSTTLATKYFNPVLYTGNGSTQTISGVGFQPDLVWIKCRSNARNHVLGDVLRGPTYRLSSNLTSAESNVTNGITAFTSDGFSLGDDGQANNLNETEVAWNWKANGSGSTNTAGSITSTVSANTTSGFSVVTYTGTGVSASVGHGLGALPQMIIVKRRNSTADWAVYHRTLGANTYLFLNSTAASASVSNYWQYTTSPGNPTVDWFGVIGGYEVNVSSATYVAYCFAEVAGYSKFGSYTGNGSTDGPFVFTGFRPAFVLTKRTDSTGDWQLMDSSRDTYNVSNKALFPNTSDAETTGYSKDFLSNGFKIRDSGASLNASGGTYIFMAFASAPLKFSLAR